MNKLQCVFDVKTQETIPIDLDEIIKSRALFQANSGGGKSYLLRKFLEESHGKVQQLIIDPEGEFKTLKEKYDYLLVSREDSADIKLETRHAGLLARKLMETGASAILDLYELNPFDRIRFVKAFVEALVNLPKNLWHPCIIVIDEIHTFAPENAKGTSESLQAVADLASRGRKRGYALIGATQKLSKFHKDVAAELNTKFTGRCVLDIDQKRAAAELGMKDYTELRNLKNEFYAFGPAISGTPILVKAYEVKTRHEDIGSSKPIQAASQEKINKLKESFKDLPVEAEQELKTIQDYQKKIQEQNIEIRNLKNNTNKTNITNNISKESLIKAEQTGYQKGIKEAEQKFVKFQSDLKNLLKSFQPIISRVSSYAEDIAKIKAMNSTIDDILKTPLDLKLPKPEVKYNVDLMSKNVPVPPLVKNPESISSLQIDSGISEPERNVLRAVAQLGTSNRIQIAILAQYSPTSGGYAGTMAKLLRKNLITGNGEGISITQEGLAALGPWEPLPTDMGSLLKTWREKLGEGPGKIISFLCENYPNAYPRDDIARSCNYSPTSGGFAGSMATLSKMDLIEKTSDGFKASKNMFPGER